MNMLKSFCPKPPFHPQSLYWIHFSLLWWNMWQEAAQGQTGLCWSSVRRSSAEAWGSWSYRSHSEEHRALWGSVFFLLTHCTTLVQTVMLGLPSPFISSWNSLIDMHGSLRPSWFYILPSWQYEDCPHGICWFLLFGSVLIWSIVRSTMIHKILLWLMHAYSIRHRQTSSATSCGTTRKMCTHWSQILELYGQSCQFIIENYVFQKKEGKL